MAPNAHQLTGNARRNVRLVLCCLILVLGVAGQGFSKPVAWKTGAIKITGNTGLSQDSLRKTMETRPGNWFRSQKYSHSRLVSDLDAIKDLYDRNGYLQMDIRIDSVVYDTVSRRAALYIGIAEGPRTIIDSVLIIGKTALSIPRMQRSLNAKTNTPLNREANDKDAEHLENIHKGRGYLFCRVKDSAIADSVTHRARVSYRIDQGPMVLAGPFKINGLRDVRPIVVKRQLRFQEGDTLTSRKINGAVRRLYGTALFNFAQIEPVAKNDLVGKDTIHPPININFEEADFFMMNASAGYGTIDRFRGSVLTRYSNLFGLGHTLSFTGNGSYLIQGANLAYSVPWFFSLPVRAELSAYVEHHNINYLGLFDGLTFSLSQDAAWYFSYRLWTGIERTEYSEPLTDSVPVRSNTNTEKIGFNVTWDNRPGDRRLKRGFCFLFQPELAGLGGKGTNQYYRGLIDLRAYSRPFPWMRGSNAITVAYAKGYKAGNDGVPPEARYYIGIEGIRPLRGYTQDEIFPGGGRVVLLINAFEGQFTIYKWIGGSLFIDGGYAEDNPAEVKLRKIRWVAGPGIFFKTAIGDLQFDWGYRLNENRWGSPYISFGQVF